MIALASWKLQNGDAFRAMDKDHVFAVLSQHLCLSHFGSCRTCRLQCCTSHEASHWLLNKLQKILHTLAFRIYPHNGQYWLLHNTPDPDHLWQVLSTLSCNLCSMGLVEKGILGELSACTLILIAHNFTTPPHSHSQNLLKPVPLLHFLDPLFGRDIFTCSDRLKFDNAFGMAHVNFMHWIITQDSIPEKPSL